MKKIIFKRPIVRFGQPMLNFVVKSASNGVIPMLTVNAIVNANIGDSFEIEGIVKLKKEVHIPSNTKFGQEGSGATKIIEAGRFYVLKQPVNGAKYVPVSSVFDFVEDKKSGFCSSDFTDMPNSEMSEAFSDLVTVSTDSVNKTLATGATKGLAGKDGKPLAIPKDQIPLEYKVALEDKPTFLWMPKTIGITVASVGVIIIGVVSFILIRKYQK